MERVNLIARVGRTFLSDGFGLGIDRFELSSADDHLTIQT
jgi:hypothetical protein